MAATKTTEQVKVSAAKRAFFVNLLDMSWRLFGAILVPILLGAFIDSKQSSGGQGFTLAGFILAIIFAIIVIYGLVRKIMKNGGNL